MSEQNNQRQCVILRATKSPIAAMAVSLLLAASPTASAGGGETGVAKTRATEDQSGTLRLTVADAATGQPVPALLQVTDSKGKSYVAEDAVPTGSCYRGRDKPWLGNLDQALANLKTSFENPYLRRIQFYADGACKLLLPVDTFQVSLAKELMQVCIRTTADAKWKKFDPFGGAGS